MNSATFDKDRVYRYTLWREWENPDMFRIPKTGYVNFIGLNPSTADETKDDRTIITCKHFSMNWGYDAFCMTNLFAFRSTDPSVMFALKTLELATGPDNDAHLLKTAAGAALVIAAWGDFSQAKAHAKHVQLLLESFPLFCLRKCSSGAPHHPLYLPLDITPVPYP